MRTIWVKAGGNGPVILPTPIQGVRAVGDEPMEVEHSRFIRRRIAVGDLVEVDAPAQPAAAPAPAPGGGPVFNADAAPATDGRTGRS